MNRLRIQLQEDLVRLAHALISSRSKQIIIKMIENLKLFDSNKRWLISL